MTERKKKGRIERTREENIIARDEKEESTKREYEERETTQER